MTHIHGVELPSSTLTVDQSLPCKLTTVYTIPLGQRRFKGYIGSDIHSQWINRLTQQSV